MSCLCKLVSSFLLCYLVSRIYMYYVSYMLRRLLFRVEESTSPIKVLLLFFGAAVFATCVINMLFGQLKLDGEATMDSQTYYTSETFYRYLDIQGESGRQSYLILHIFDYLYIICSSLFMAFAIALIEQSTVGLKRFRALIFLPLIGGLFDVLENVIVDLSIIVYPSRVPLVASVAGVFTVLKLVFLGLSIITLFSMLFLFIIRVVICRWRK